MRISNRVPLYPSPCRARGNAPRIPSAYGYIIVDVLDAEGNPLSGKQSFEVFGNNIDRRVLFEDGSGFDAYAGRAVRLRFRMRDAKLYSMKFEN